MTFFQLLLTWKKKPFKDNLIHLLDHTVIHVCLEVWQWVISDSPAFLANINMNPFDASLHTPVVLNLCFRSASRKNRHIHKFPQQSPKTSVYRCRFMFHFISTRPCLTRWRQAILASGLSPCFTGWSSTYLTELKWFSDLSLITRNGSIFQSNSKFHLLHCWHKGFPLCARHRAVQPAAPSTRMSTTCQM